jgi:hypothetical protein
VVAGAVMFTAAGTPRAADLPPVDPDPVRAAFFDDAIFTLHLRSYLFDQSHNEGDDPAAWAIGGWVGYETGWLADILKFGAVGYTSQPLWAPPDREGSLLLLPDQDGFSVLGQAYAALRYDDQVLTLYRQLVNQPEVNPHDNRMVPNTFEGGSLAGKFDSFAYYAAYLTRMKTRDADDFVNMAKIAGAGQDEPMYLGGLSFSRDEDFKAQSSLYVIPNLLVSSYSDAKLTVGQVDQSRFNLSGQFMIQSGIGEQLLTGTDFESWVFGIKGDIICGGLTLTAGYTANGSDDDWRAPFGAWPGYTNMIIGVFSRAQEQALLLGASYDLADLGIEGLNVGVNAALDTAVAQDLPTWSEVDFNAGYSLSSVSDIPAWLSPLSFQAYFALLQSDYPGGGSNLSNELRLMLNYEVQSRGRDLFSSRASP